MIRRLKSLLPEKSPKKPLPRASRLQVHPLHDITFEHEEGRGQRTLIANLSETGVGLIADGTLPSLSKGDRFRGHLIFPEARFPAELRVAHVAPGSVGCAFEPIPTALREMILGYFELEISGQALSEVNPSILKAEPSGTPRLFLGRRNCELFFIEKEGRIVRFELSFLGNYIEGGEDQPTRCGFLSMPETDRLQYKGSSIVRLVSTHSPEVLRGAVRLLDNIQKLEPDQRAAIRALIRRASRSDRSAP